MNYPIEMSKSHVVIAGTGRAGTTLLVQLFTKLGLDTGFSEEDFKNKIDPVSHGGLEVNLEGTDFEQLPYLIKSPYFYQFADKILNNPKTPIDHVIIPVRNLEDATKSRIRVQEYHEKESGLKLKSDLVPGGLVMTDSIINQEVVLARQLTLLIKSLAKSGVPHTFLAFPTFANNPDYLYKAVKFLIPNTSFEVFLEIFQGIVDLGKIHDFQDWESSDYDILDHESFLNDISHDPYLYGVDDYMPSAWIGHAPFMKFIVRDLKPKIFVELGVHNGFSYFVGCQAIRECGFSTKAYAIDHWEGDAQAGFFDDSVYKGVIRTNSKYSGFSTLIKSSFLDALTSFKDNSIDLLHIDGFHTYESVKEDFETWLPKMSKDGVILLHDIHVRRNTFGVFKFWQEIKTEFKTIEFFGSHGLGVVFNGKVPAGKCSELFRISENGNEAQINGTFGSISDDVIQTFSLRNNAVAERNNAVAERNNAVAERDNAVAERDNAVAERDNAVAERDNAVAERDSISNSTIWRAFGPYRKLNRFKRRI